MTMQRDKRTYTHTHNIKYIKVRNKEERNAFHAWWSLAVNQQVYTRTQKYIEKEKKENI
jgi:hypothetical protein